MPFTDERLTEILNQLVAQRDVGGDGVGVQEYLGPVRVHRSAGRGGVLREAPAQVLATSGSPTPAAAPTPRPTGTLVASGYIVARRW